MRPHRTHAAPRRPRWRAAILPSAMVALMGAWISGCSVLYSLDTAQCSTDADCVALGGAFAELACVEHLCQEPEGWCDSNADCIDRLGFGGEPYACIERECVALRTTECPQILPQTNEGWLEALRDDNPVILAGTGLIGNGNNFDPFLKNYDLALTELNVNVQGVNQGTRPLVMLGCKATYEDRAELDRMMVHLSQTVKVPAMLPAMAADDLQYAFQTYGQPAKMFFMSPLESDAALGAIGDDGLLWHVGPDANTVGRAYAPLLKRTLEHLAISGPVRVAAVVANGERFMTNLMATITAGPSNYGIVFNDQSVSDNLGENYLQLTTEDLSSTITALLEFKPHIIISATARDFYTDVITGVESNWDASSGQPKPFYLLSIYNYNDSVGLPIALNGNPGLRTRLAGINAAAAEDQENYGSYRVRYTGQFQAFDAGYENFYDAAYYLMYSLGAVATTSSLQTGEDLPRGMRRLIGASNPFDVGVTDLPNGLAQVAAGATIQLNGTMGPPVWNDNGTRNLPGSVYCINASDDYEPDVLLYREATPGDASSVTLEGDFSCFDFGPPTP